MPDLYTGYGATRTQRFNVSVRRIYPLLYLIVMLLGYFVMLG